MRPCPCRSCPCLCPCFCRWDCPRIRDRFFCSSSTVVNPWHLRRSVACFNSSNLHCFLARRRIVGELQRDLLEGWRVTGSKIPTNIDRACISQTPSPVTSSTNFILPSISVKKAIVSLGPLLGRATIRVVVSISANCRNHPRP